jgi:hypothetical protein
MRLTLGEGLLRTARILFLVLYVFAAAAYGLTREGPLTVFQWGMGVTLVLWILAHLVLWRTPGLGLLPWLTTGLILLFGWFVTATGWLDAAVTDGRLSGTEAWLSPDLLTNWGSYVPELSQAAMTRTTVLLGAMLMAIDLWRHPHWARALLATLVFSSLGMVLFFLLQRTFGGPFILTDLTRKVPLSFATYRYWGNAAAYLNLFWPIVVAIALRAALRQSFAWPLWLIPAIALFAANFLNVSKAGNVLAGIGLVVLLGLNLSTALEELKKRRIRMSRVLVALIPLLIIVGSLPLAIPWKRWEYMAKTAHEEGDRGRIHAYKAFLTMLPDSGWVGFGPGTFQQMYVRYVEDDPNLRYSSYWVAHQDYIQTAVEWGYLGTILWALVLIPGGTGLLVGCLRKSTPASRAFDDYRISIFDHLQAFLKTLPGPRDPFVAKGAFVSVLLITIHSMGDFPMQIASLQLYFLVLIALGWSYFRPLATTKSPD